MATINTTFRNQEEIETALAALNASLDSLGSWATAISERSYDLENPVIETTATQITVRVSNGDEIIIQGNALDTETPAITSIVYQFFDGTAISLTGSIVGMASGAVYGSVERLLFARPGWGSIAIEGRISFPPVDASHLDPAAPLAGVDLSAVEISLSRVLADIAGIHIELAVSVAADRQSVTLDSIILSANGMSFEAHDLAYVIDPGQSQDPQMAEAFLQDMLCGSDMVVASGSTPVTLLGFGGADILMGSPLNDVLDGGPQDDTLDGRMGIDVARYAGRLSQFTLDIDPALYNIQRVTGPDGADSLMGIERLEFSDCRVAFDGEGHAGQAFRLYQAAFARLPDLSGLGSWIDAMDDGMSLEQVAQAFIGCEEFQALYGAQSSDADFVTLLYLNALNRAPAPGEAAGWIGQLADGTISRAQLLIQFSESIENKNAVAARVAEGILYADTPEQATLATQGLTLAGTAGADSLFGSVGKDRFYGQGGDDTLIGGANVDTAVYSGSRADYAITNGGGSHIVASVAEGNDTLVGIERLQFTDMVLALDIDGHAGQVYRLYQAAFNRTPDTPGLTDWILRGADQGMTLQNIANAFLASAEFQTLYGANPDNDAFVTALYHNALDREPDEGGKAYWVTQLDNGLAREMVLIGFSESAENQAKTIGVIQEGIELMVA